MPAKTKKPSFEPAWAKTPEGEKAVEAAKLLKVFCDHVFGNRTVLDVYLWDTGKELKYACIGHGHKLTNAFRLGNDEKGDSLASKWPINRGHNRSGNGYLETIAGQFFGDEHGHNGYWHDDKIYPHDILSGLAANIRHYLGVDEEEITIEVILMPIQGRPWWGTPGAFYSVKSKGWLPAEKPSWEIGPVEVQVSGEYKNVMVADLCKVSPRLEPKEGWDRSVYLPSGKDRIIFTHSFHLENHPDSEEDLDAAIQIASCGGLLYPSIAIGTMPAHDFLGATLFLSPWSVMDGVRDKDSRTKVYNTDAWTPTTRGLITEYAYRWYQELCGLQDSQDYMYNWWNFFMSDGLNEDYTNDSGAAESTMLIKKESQVLKAASRRAKSWPLEKMKKDIDVAKLIQKNEAPVVSRYRPDELVRSPEFYPFLEAKMSYVVTFGCVMFAAVPDYKEKLYRRFLASAGYKGPFVVYETTQRERDALERKNRNIKDVPAEFRNLGLGDWETVKLYDDTERLKLSVKVAKTIDAFLSR